MPARRSPSPSACSGKTPPTSSHGVDNLWVYDLGGVSSLDVSSGWHTLSFKVVDAQVPSWSPTRTVCASGMHAIGITVQNNEVIDDSNGQRGDPLHPERHHRQGQRRWRQRWQWRHQHRWSERRLERRHRRLDLNRQRNRRQGRQLEWRYDWDRYPVAAAPVAAGAGGSTGGLASAAGERHQAAGSKRQGLIVLRGSSLLDIGTLYVMVRQERQGHHRSHRQARRGRRAGPRHSPTRVPAQQRQRGIPVLLGASLSRGRHGPQQQGHFGRHGD